MIDEIFKFQAFVLVYEDSSSLFTKIPETRPAFAVNAILNENDMNCGNTNEIKM